MDRINEMVNLLQNGIPFVLVKVYEVHQKGLCIQSPMLVTKDEILGEYFSYTQDLALEARKSLEKSKSHSCKNFSQAFDVCFEFFGQQKTLLIVGAGHIAVPLCQMAHILGFRIIVVDDRKECAQRERFPHASEILVTAYTEGLKKYPVDHNTYVVLVTPGHVYDKDCLKILLQKQEAAYIGMICSRRRKEATWKLLKDEGYSQDQLDYIYAPIGLPTGGETPEEIALSIISEIVALRNKGEEWVRNIRKK